MRATTQNVVLPKYAAMQNLQPPECRNSEELAVNVSHIATDLPKIMVKMMQRTKQMLHRINALGTPLAPLRRNRPESGRLDRRAVKMATDIDLHVGKRLRRRRRLLGLTQQELAGQVGVRFQQIQKYECGANRITSGRLFDLSRALNVKVQYFFDGLAEQLEAGVTPANDTEGLEGDILSQKETLELVRAYYRLSERPRRRLLELAKALESDAADVAS